MSKRKGSNKKVSGKKGSRGSMPPSKRWWNKPPAKPGSKRALAIENNLRKETATK